MQKSRGETLRTQSKTREATTLTHSQVSEAAPAPQVACMPGCLKYPPLKSLWFFSDRFFQAFPTHLEKTRAAIARYITIIYLM